MNRTNAKYGGLGCGAIALIVVVVLALSFGAWYFRVQTAGFFGSGNLQRTVQSAPMQLNYYNHFFDLCVSVQNAENGIDATKAMADSDRKDYNIAALQATRQRGINQYNADARKDWTSAQFLASNLPYQLATEAYTGDNKTQCAS